MENITNSDLLKWVLLVGILKPSSEHLLPLIDGMFRESSIKCVKHSPVLLTHGESLFHLCIKVMACRDRSVLE